MSDDRSLNSMTAADYERYVKKIADGFRRLADDIEREGRPAKIGLLGRTRYLAAAENVQHAITWGVANIGAYYLISRAEMADDAERETPR